MVGNRWQAGQGFGSITGGIAGGLRGRADEAGGVFDDPGPCDCSSCCYHPPTVPALPNIALIDTSESPSLDCTKCKSSLKMRNVQCPPKLHFSAPPQNGY